MSAATLWQGVRNGFLKPVAAVGQPNRDPRTTVESVLSDAEMFLYHVTSTGKSIDPKIRDPIITARMELANGSLGKERISDLYEAYSSLAIAAKPVTVETIRACRDLSLRTLKRYRKSVLRLTVIVAGLSISSFVASAIIQKIGDDITQANKLAVKLSAELGPLPDPRDLNTQLQIARRDHSHAADASPKTPTGGASSGWRDQVPGGLNVADVIGDLQQFTALSRELYDRARLVHYLTNVADPFAAFRDDYKDVFWRLFQLPIAATDLRQTTSDKIYLFQRIRVFGNDVQFNVLTFNGAIGAYLLPILYAVLGAFAFGLRKFSQEIVDMTYHPSQANAARIITATICGTIVGLFSNFWQGISLQPLAIAFLVGYGVEVFFAFLDKLLQSLGAAGATVRAPSPSGSAA